MGKIRTAHPDRYMILKENSRINRFCATDAERELWQHLRKSALGVKFRRQHCVGDYIADFICLDKHLIIEVDGGYHYTEEQQREDNIRTDSLNRLGFYVLRFTNDMVFNDIYYVLDRIKELLTKL